MSSWISDVRFALRMAAKNPWMTGACIFALGAAMAVAIGGFSLLWATYFAELPFEDGDRIVAVRDIMQPDPDDAPPRLAVFREWAQRQQSLEVLAAAYLRSREVADGEGGLIRYPVAVMTASGFEVARVPPLYGRVLRAADQDAGASAVVIVGHNAWQALFGGDPAAIGKTLNIDGEDREVVGIMPEGFRFPMSEQLWVPMNTEPTALGGVEPRWMRVFGRLATGVTIEQAQAELDAIRRGYAEEHPEDVDVRDRFTTVIPYVQADSESGTEVLFIGSFVFIVFVLVVACASVANLLLARATARTGEIAVRAALGASRRRLVGQLFIEALLLTSAGAAFGVIAAQISLSWFATQVPPEATPFWVEFGMRPAAAVFAVIAAFGAALVAGVAPALKATGIAMHDVLKDEQGTTSSVRFGSISGALTIVEVTLSVAFLAAAALAAQSLLVAINVDEELPTREVLVARVAMVQEMETGPDGEIAVGPGSIAASQWLMMQEEMRSAAESIPGVRSAALAISLPGDQHFLSSIEPEGETAGEPASGVRVPVAVVSPELFGAFNATLLAGRGFGPTDTLESEPVAIVNASFARRFFGPDSPVGGRFRRQPGDEASPWIRIVGVCSDLRLNPGSEQAAGYYVPFAQRLSNNFSLALRVDGDPLALSAALRETIRGVDARIDVSGFETHQQRTAQILVAFRMMGLMFAALGGTAFFLSLAGLYAVMAFSVAQRTREIGIRLALGADKGRVLGVILRRGLLQVGTGIALGSALGWSLLRLMQFIPIGMASSGSGLLAVAGATMLVAGLIACVVPATRAIAVRPVDALRHQ